MLYLRKYIKLLIYLLIIIAFPIFIMPLIKKSLNYVINKFIYLFVWIV